MKVRHKYLVNDPRNGRDRYYVRKTGYPKVRLKSPFNTPAFWLEYNNALRKLETLSKAPAQTKFTPGTLGWLFEQYMSSPEYQALGPATQKERRLVYKRISDHYGTHQILALTKRDFYGLRDAQADTPAMANKFITFCKYAFKWANKRELIDVSPVEGVEALKRQSKGFVPWTEQDIKNYVKRWPLGTKQYLALIVLATINGRRGDAAKMGHQRIEGDRVEYTHEKTKNPMSIDLSPFLAQAIDHTETGDFTLLISDRGTPFTKESFGNAFKRWCVAAGVNQKGKSTHGVRKAFASWAADAGATGEQLMAGFGWRNRAQVSTYTEHAKRVTLSKSVTDATDSKLSQLLGSETKDPEKVVKLQGGKK